MVEVHASEVWRAAIPKCGLSLAFCTMPTTTNQPKIIPSGILASGARRRRKRLRRHVPQTKWGAAGEDDDGQVLAGLRTNLTSFGHGLCLQQNEGIATLERKSVKKKLKDKAFAAKVNREIIRSSVELLGMGTQPPHPVRNRRLETRPFGRNSGIAGRK